MAHARRALPSDLSALGQMTPLGRAGQADEVARLALFWRATRRRSSPGQDIAIDGGFCVGMRFEADE